VARAIRVAHAALAVDFPCAGRPSRPPRSCGRAAAPATSAAFAALAAFTAFTALALRFAPWFAARGTDAAAGLGFGFRASPLNQPECAK